MFNVPRFINPIFLIGRLINSIYLIRSPAVFTDFIYYATSNGRDFKRLCDFVHDFSTDLIRKRRETLVRNIDLSFVDQKYKKIKNSINTTRTPANIVSFASFCHKWQFVFCLCIANGKQKKCKILITIPK